MANQVKQTRVLDSIVILPLRKKKDSIIIQTGYGQAKMTKQWLSNKKRKRKKRLNNLVSAVAQVNEVIALTCKPFFFFWL